MDKAMPIFRRLKRSRSRSLIVSTILISKMKFRPGQSSQAQKKRNQVIDVTPLKIEIETSEKHFQLGAHSTVQKVRTSFEKEIDSQWEYPVLYLLSTGTSSQLGSLL